MAIPVLAAVGAAVGAGLNYVSAQQTNQMQRDLYEDQKNFSVDMMNRQNAYNSPAAQMERLQAAGLNPNLIYNKGGALPSAVATTPNAPQMKDPLGNIQLGQMALQAQQIYNQKRQLDIQERIADSQVNLNKAKEQQAISDANKTASDDMLVQENILNAKQLRQYQSDLHAIDVATRDVDLHQKQFTYGQSQLLGKLDVINSQLRNEQLVQEIHNSKVRIGLEQALNGASISSILSRADYTKTQAAFLKAIVDYRIEKEAYEVEFQKVRNNMSKEELERLKEYNSGYNVANRYINTTFSTVRNGIGIATDLNKAFNPYSSFFE